ncbi:hypothetical protein [Polynucleobacter yangtzensis]|uniref:Uncharacterized protein n=1 Tax=Polynucleobacter yangtzensis TaxID=1743159 RepID=A0ABM8CN32_9BURK|nr:hypothetical protein [Polynucleobacter yangtzensis]BDT79219.1 hypothetical protein PKF032_11070 [Polynucleobacter yangtzensis]
MIKLVQSNNPIKQAIEYVGFDGTNPQVIAGLYFNLADELIEAGYSNGDVALMMEKCAAFLRTLGE